MTIALTTISDLTRYATAYFEFVRNPVPDRDAIDLGDATFYFRASVNEESSITDVLVGNSVGATIENFKTQLALAMADENLGPSLALAEYSWVGARLTVTALAPGISGLDFNIERNSYPVSPHALFIKGTPNVVPGDTFTLNGITFTFIATDEGEEQSLTDVTYDAENTYNSFYALVNKMNTYKSAGGQGNPLVNTDYSTGSEYFEITVYGSDEEPNLGGGMPYSWNLTSATLNSTHTGSGSLSEYDAGNRITISSDDLELADFEYSGVDAIYTNTDFEAAVAALMKITANILGQTDDPTDDVTTTRRQRALLKRVLKWLSQEITTSASSSLDDREILANRLIAKMGSRFVALNKASALSPIEDDLVAPDGFSFLLDGDGNYITIGDSYVIAPTPP